MGQTIAFLSNMRCSRGHRASGIGHRASGIGHRASGIGIGLAPIPHFLENRYTSNPVRQYTRFIRILKIIQYLGFFVVVLLGFLILDLVSYYLRQSFLAVVALVFLLQASFGCGTIYVVTQALIAIVDLLSRIEQNTRP